MLNYDAILFDVDGTLIDSAPGIIHTLQATFAGMGVDVSDVDLHCYVGPPLRRTFGEYFAEDRQIEQATELYRKFYKDGGSHECVLYPGVETMLQTLRSVGLALYTATSKPIQVVTPILEEQGIAPYFTYIGGASMDRSRDTKTAGMQHVLQRPELKGKRVLMVGDRQDDMQGAVDCGLPAAGVLYGYGSMQELQPFSPVVYANSCEELTDYILNDTNGD